MSDLLRELPVLVLDGQAGGATPAYGDLIELGWAACTEAGLLAPVQSHWIVPRTNRPISRAVRELTGWTEACVAGALPEHEAWATLREQAARIATSISVAPTVIHFARFELPFLRDLHARLEGAGEFPLEVVCVHAIAVRLFPELPRRNIRALAGYLGHSPELVRRSAGHVEATAFIWRALVPLLERESVYTWSELRAWLARTPRGPRARRRTFPFAREQRRALPDRPGVYRFLRRNGDVIYVGKAASLRKRVASHFVTGARASERGLELLSQVHDVHVSETASVLEAALLEADEIKRLDPPYNVQLRSGERSAWFASRDLRDAVSVPDDAHRVGPLPSQRALGSFAALIALAQGAEPSPGLRAAALAVPVAYLPEPSLFWEGWEGFVRDHLRGAEGSAVRVVDRAARKLWWERGRVELEAPEETAELWDLARVRRRLERHLIQGGLLMRRARWLRLLAEVDVAFRERDMERPRALRFAGGALVEVRELASLADLTELAVRRFPSRRARQAAFDAAAYDRVRVLSTELARVQAEGGEIALRFGSHVFTGAALGRLMATV